MKLIVLFPYSTNYPNTHRFVGHRIIVHKDSESRLVGNLREITPKKTLLLTETFKQKVDGAIEVLGKIVSYMEF